MITYTKYNEKYKAELNKLQQSIWGANSDSDEIFEHIDDYNIELALDGEKLVGASINCLLNKDILFIEMIVVAKEYQHQGVGTRLLTDVLTFASVKGCKLIKTKAVEVNGHINALSMLEKNGFCKGEKIEKYWGRFYPHFRCLECGKCPCVCNMVEYFKFLY